MKSNVNTAELDPGKNTQLGENLDYFVKGDCGKSVLLINGWINGRKLR